MLDPKSQNDLKDAIGECIGADASVLDALRSEIRPLKSLVRRIQPRATTSISLVGTDGGNNQLQFDPFLIQMIRVVDSSDNQYCLEVVSPTTPVGRLVRRHLDQAGAPITALGEMMSFLGVKSLPDLSHMIRPNDGGRPVSPSWVQVYRELVEWAVLFALLKKDFGTDTLIVCDGLLRSKVFAKDIVCFIACRHQRTDRRAMKLTRQEDHRDHPVAAPPRPAAARPASAAPGRRPPHPPRRVVILGTACSAFRHAGAADEVAGTRHRPRPQRTPRRQGGRPPDRAQVVGHAGASAARTGGAARPGAGSGPVPTPVLVGALVALVGLAVFAAVETPDVRGTPSAQNTALVDIGTTAQVSHAGHGRARPRLLVRLHPPRPERAPPPAP